MTRSVLIADLFCGAGGSTTGAEKACRELGLEPIFTCVNHWPVAIETHRANHPTARHYVEDVNGADPERLVPEGRLDLLMASPECRFHSRARGGKPIHDQNRMSAWCIQRWCTALDVPVVLIENVPEFVDWGPIDPKTKKPIKAKKGTYFRAWLAAFWQMGYRTEYRVLNCADFGDATTRRRFFLFARNDGKAIVWPEATHARPDLIQHGSPFEKRLPWRPAREVIHKWRAGTSIFGRKKPLSDKTLLRILRGAEKYWGALAPFYARMIVSQIRDRELLEKLKPGSAGHEAAIPFLLPQRENNLAKPVSEPVPTIVTRARLGLVEPVLIGANRNHNVPRPDSEPVPAVTTAHGGGLYAVEAVLGQHGGAALRPVDDPLPTIATGGAIALVEPLLTAYNGNGHSSSVTEPVPTVTGKPRFGLVEPVMIGRHGGPSARSVEEPMPTITASGGPLLAEPIIVSRFSNGWVGAGTPARSVEEPLSTIVGSPGGAGCLAEPVLIPYRGEREGQEPRCHSTAEPLPTITAGGIGAALCEPVMLKVTHDDPSDRTRSLDEPLWAVTKKRGIALAWPTAEQLAELGADVDPVRVVVIDGVPHYGDILYRMLENDELSRATSLDDEEAKYEFVGTKEEVTKQIGNAVPRRTATALVLAAFHTPSPCASYLDSPNPPIQITEGRA